jgi:hypothetical protein
MKSKHNIPNKLSEADKQLLKDAAEKIGDKILFPEKVEDAKKYLEEATFVTPISPVKK